VFRFYLRPSDLDCSIIPIWSSQLPHWRGICHTAFLTKIRRIPSPLIVSKRSMEEIRLYSWSKVSIKNMLLYKSIGKYSVTKTVNHIETIWVQTLSKVGENEFSIRIYELFIQSWHSWRSGNGRQWPWCRWRIYKGLKTWFLWHTELVIALKRWGAECLQGTRVRV
jgi:hypothetical protein